MNKKLKDKVEASIAWKMSNEKCAEKLGISLEHFNKIKKEIYKEKKQRRKELLSGEFEYDTKYDLDKGEGRVTGYVDSEPKSADEIIKILKIDTTLWKLSSYWNKQMAGKWRISALVTRNKNHDPYLVELLEKWKPKKYKVSGTIKQDRRRTKVCGILSLQDIHFGKVGNQTIDKDFEDTLKDLLPRGAASHYITDVYFVLGGDLINMDTFVGTTTAGTHVESHSKATEAYIQAFDAIHWGINYIKQFCDKLHIVYIPGNHDRLSSFHLAHALSKSIVDKNIVWDVEYSERKVHIWNNSFLAFEHGDVNKKNSAVIYATEFPVKWGGTKHRTLFSGHYHSAKRVEYITQNEDVGFVHKTLPSLSHTDYWHYHNKFIGNRRAGVIELHDAKNGNICELVYVPS